MGGGRWAGMMSGNGSEKGSGGWGFRVGGNGGGGVGNDLT